MIEPKTGPDNAVFRVIRLITGGWALHHRADPGAHYQPIGPASFERPEHAMGFARSLVDEAPNQTFLDGSGNVIDHHDEGEHRP